MKIKTKLIASIMSICLVCAVFAIGVFALKTANLKIGGDVSFTATGVEAHVKNASVTGAVTQTTLAANDAEGEVINTSMTQADIDTTFANWSDIELDFDQNATDIELKFDIANTSTNKNNYIEIDYSYSFSNSSPNVDVFPGDENAQKVWENNNYILAPKAAAANATYETFTLKFRVLDKELNVPQDTKVNLTISLKHITPVEGTLADGKITTPDGLIYKVGENDTMSLGSENDIGNNYSYEETSVNIAPIVSDGTNNYIVTTIEDYAFYHYYLEVGNTNIEKLKIPVSIKSIGNYAFYNCTNLTSVEMGVGVTSIGSAFYGCTNLTSITIPASVTSIGSAFSGCTNLTSITIPASVTSIDSSAFYCCTALTSMVVSSGNSIYDSRNNANAIIETATNTLLGGCMNTKIPYGVKTIYYGAFYMCTGLTSITIPDSVETINNGAFASTGLTSVTIPDSVKTLGDAVFSGCENLTSVTLGKGLTRIGMSLFSDCSSLSEIVISDGITAIETGAFSGCTSLTSIIIPDSVQTIWNLVFYGCTGLNSVTIGFGVSMIYGNAFAGCESLTLARFENPTGWFVANRANATSGTPATVTSDFTEDNATVLKGVEDGEYLLRKDA